MAFFVACLGILHAMPVRALKYLQEKESSKINVDLAYLFCYQQYKIFFICLYIHFLSLSLPPFSSALSSCFLVSELKAVVNITIYNIIPSI